MMNEDFVKSSSLSRIDSKIQAPTDISENGLNTSTPVRKAFSLESQRRGEKFSSLIKTYSNANKVSDENSILKTHDSDQSNESTYYDTKEYIVDSYVCISETNSEIIDFAELFFIDDENTGKLCKVDSDIKSEELLTEKHELVSKDSCIRNSKSLSSLTPEMNLNLGNFVFDIFTPAYWDHRQLYETLTSSTSLSDEIDDPRSDEDYLIMNLSNESNDTIYSSFTAADFQLALDYFSNIEQLEERQQEQMALTNQNSMIQTLHPSTITSGPTFLITTNDELFEINNLNATVSEHRILSAEVYETNKGNGIKSHSATSRKGKFNIGRKLASPVIKEIILGKNNQSFLEEKYPYNTISSSVLSYFEPSESFNALNANIKNKPVAHLQKKWKSEPDVKVTAEYELTETEINDGVTKSRQTRSEDKFEKHSMVTNSVSILSNNLQNTTSLEKRKIKTKKDENFQHSSTSNSNIIEDIEKITSSKESQCKNIPIAKNSSKSVNIKKYKGVSCFCNLFRRKNR